MTPFTVRVTAMIAVSRCSATSVSHQQSEGGGSPGRPTISGIALYAALALESLLPDFTLRTLSAGEAHDDARRLADDDN